MNKTSKKNIKGKIAFFSIGFVLAALLVVSQRAVAQAMEGSAVEGPEDLALRAVALYSIDHPDSIIANKLLDVLLARKEERIGVVMTDSKASPVDRTCYRDSDGVVCTATGWEVIDFPSVSSATTTASEPNRLSVPFIIDQGEVFIKGFVTSTFAVSVGTTTNQFGPVSNASSSLVLYPKSIIQRTLVSSSSLPLGTSVRIEQEPGDRDIIMATTSVGSAYGTVGTHFEVATSSFVTVFLQDQANAAGAQDGFCREDNQTCTSVTSSQRQFTGGFRYRYHYNVNL